MSSTYHKMYAAMFAAAAVLGYAGVSSAALGDDQIDTSIQTISDNVTRYAGAALTAVVAVVLLAVGIRIVPKVIRAVAARVTG